MMSGAAASEDLPRGEGDQLLRARSAADYWGSCGAVGSAFAGAESPLAGALSAGAELPASAGAVGTGELSGGSAGAVRVSRSIAERIGSRGLRLRSASKIACRAPEGPSRHSG